ncbi:hypothetical protein [Chryseolinea lacunae]|uniref:DUF4595 domain-containing protein n=1 Tax=Chryseolinea lacunae TaxID=2801331 RepID=A0ABS1KS53_9BACT|nr:hypothetical protein [Chryseolinea lacunae]MBL0742290.1 hypothetical protein [Chryseolinea lacunae]
MKFHFFSALLVSVAMIGCDNENDSPSTPDVIPGPKLRSVSTFFQNASGFRPAEKTIFTYDAFGRVSAKEYLTYDLMDKGFHHFSTTQFNYDGNLLSTTDELNVVNHRTITRYQYFNNRVSKMLRDDVDVDTEVSVSYLAGDTVKAFYKQSSGRSFTYMVHAPLGNVTFEKTINDGNELSSIVTNEFDGHTNPYSLLHFTDLFFSNLSKSNKTKTESAYFTHQPNSVPVSYSYTYNSDGLPTEQMITYKSWPNGEVTSLLKVVFEY